MQNVILLLKDVNPSNALLVGAWDSRKINNLNLNSDCHSNYSLLFKNPTAGHEITNQNAYFSDPAFTAYKFKIAGWIKDCSSRNYQSKK